MAPANFEPMATCHVVALPYPGRGHINPMLNLCNLLASRSTSTDHILITFVVTEEWLGLIGSQTKPANIRFATIPNVIPSELGRAADILGFVEATMTKMEDPFERLLDRLEPPVNVIIADTFLGWAVEFGNRRDIPVASLWTMPASVFSIFYHSDLLVRGKHFPVELSERGEERVDFIPGVSPIRLADFPTIIQEKDQRLYDRCLQILSKVTHAQYLLFSTTSELEPPVFTALKSTFQFPIYSLGPLIPHFNLQHNANDSDYLKWLDSQPHSSVLYVALGSFLSVSTAQMDEIVAGLRDSGVRYMLVARDKASVLKETCGEAGTVVTWCDQLRVLCHSSVGGFWTHCGWNSTMEGLFAGVPLLALPIIMDQVPNSKLIEEDWRVGWRVKRGENLVRREEIADIVRRFMDLESGERKEMVKRATEIKKICRRAIGKGGSSDSNLDAFIKGISK